MPEELAHVWDWFQALDLQRTLGPMGLDPLQPSEISEWFRQMDLHPTPWEMRLIYRLDIAKRAAPHKTEADTSKASASDTDAVMAMMMTAPGPRAKRKPPEKKPPP